MSKIFRSTLTKNLTKHAMAIEKLAADADLMATFEAATAKLVQCYENGGRLYLAGNGGSAADAQHLATEFVSRLARDRNPLPAEALTTDSSILTAIGNDYGFEQVFSRQIRAKMSSADMFLGITTSGRSSNIIEALRACREKGVQSILLTGHDGGEAKLFADFALVLPGEQTSTIQELHLILEHSLCECVENAIFPPG